MKVNFTNLPEDVQSYVKNYLKVYDEIHISFENGRYIYGNFIKRNYESDFTVIGSITKDDIYTKDEQILNYVNEFKDYPIEYNGKKDYSILKSGKDFTFDDNNNIVVKE